MTQGPGRFEYWLIKLDDLLIQSSRAENPAAFLYKNNARTILFMLEALAKLYEGLHNKKLFGKLKDRFKELEDLLGAADYFDSFAKDFAADPDIPAPILTFLEEKRAEKFALLNAILVKRKWINHDPLRTARIRKKLAKADWQKPKKEIESIEGFYRDAVKEISEFYKSTGDAFTDLEAQVHELRRMLRWLSIYPQALQGAVQLTDTAPEDEQVQKYLTPEIVNSPFNVMPAAGNNNHFLLLQKKYFLALSWLIAELGKLKDSGLKIFATTEAVQATEFVVDNIAVHRAFELNKTNEDCIKNIMSKAKEICSLYFEEKNLEKLVAGIAKS